jgi:hypothetical protein
MMARSWIFATLLTGMVACSSGRNSPTLGSPGVGVASVDPDAAGGHLGGASEDGGVDAPED